MFRPLILIFILLLSGLTLFLPGCEASAGRRAVHHDLRIVLDPAASSLEAVDKLRLAADGRPLNLLLSDRAEITEVRIEGRPVSRYTFRNGRLTISLPTTDNAEVTIRIAYRAIFDDRVPESPAHDEDPSYGVTAAITDRGAFLSPGAHWYPLLPGVPATFRVRVEAPSGITGITSGRMVERSQTDAGTSIVWESTHPLEAFTLAAGPYRIEEKEVPGAALYTFLYPGNARLADTYLDAAAGYLELYQGLFGPYPFAKFAVAENFFPTGYGFQSWTLLGSTVVRLPFIVETSLGHEIAHSWWGNGVQVDYSKGNWSEGLTTYVADYLFKERESAEAAREYRLKILRDYNALVSREDGYPLASFTSRKTAADQAIGYGKSAMVFHMARQRVGDEHFWAGLRALAESHFQRETSWSDFAAAWQASGDVDLSGFFRQWIDKPGAPVLNLTEVVAEQTEGVWEVRGQVLQQRPLYDLNVPLRLETGEGTVNMTVPLRRGSADFRMKSDAPPERLVVDPDFDLFRRLHPEEVPPSVNGIRGSDDLLAVVSTGLPEETVAAARGLLSALRHPQARVVREEDLETRDITGSDLLFLGMPERESLRPPLPDDLSFSADGFSIAGNAYTEPGAALFASLPHPVDPDRQSAVFLPLSAEAAQQATRKIPHYGKYSYLAFTSGDNREKGIWPIRSSPLIHDFNHQEPQQ